MDTLETLRHSVHASQFGRPFWTQAVESKYRLWASEWNKQIESAEAYAWGQSAASACVTASRSVPPDSQLLRESCPPESSGWWWFERPIQFGSHCPVHAAFWIWEPVINNRVGLHFLLMTEWPDGRLCRFCSWVWLEGLSLPAMIDVTRELPRHSISDVTDLAKPLEEQPTHLETNEEREEELKLISAFSSFFLAACAWLRQRVVVESAGPIERHHRKQIMREHGLSTQPTVRVVHLRRADYSGDRGDMSEGVEFSYSCRFVVQGHWRQQPCGPNHADRRLIYITPFIKGPDNAPLKESMRRVFQVTR